MLREHLNTVEAKAASPQLRVLAALAEATGVVGFPALTWPFVTAVPVDRTPSSGLSEHCMHVTRAISPRHRPWTDIREAAPQTEERCVI